MNVQAHRSRSSHRINKTIGDLVRAPCVLVADDDESVRAMIVAAFEADGYDVIQAKSGAELLEHLGSSILFGTAAYAPPDIIVTDVRMPGFSGLEILAGLRRAHWKTPIVLITAFSDEHVRDAAAKIGADAVFLKPFEIDALRAAVLRLVPAGAWFEYQRHFD